MHQKALFRGLAVMVVALIAVVFVTALARRKSKESSPMQDLSSTEQLKQRFQQDSGKVRLIALVSPVARSVVAGSPTCRMSLKRFQINNFAPTSFGCLCSPATAEAGHKQDLMNFAMIG